MSAHVLIIGAGLGGLTLAHGLKKAGIKVSIFERDTGNDFRAQGYRIRLWGEAILALQYCLTDETFALFKETCADTKSGPMPHVDPVSGEVKPREQGFLGGGPLGRG